MNTAALFSSEHDDWNTPSCVLDRVRQIDEIGLDPCSNAQSIVCARVEWRLDRGEDALRLGWSGHGLVFCNPPYGDGLAPFMRRMNAYGSTGVEIVALIPNRTDIADGAISISGSLLGTARPRVRARVQGRRGGLDTMSKPACGLCDEPHDIKGQCPQRTVRDGLVPLMSPVERLQLPEWRNDHGQACTCMACVMGRGERRRRAADDIADRRRPV